MACPAGSEPTTSGLENRCSIRLSYGCQQRERVEERSAPGKRRDGHPSDQRLATTPNGWQTSRMEVVFSITQEEDGGFVAECLTHDIFTQGDNWDELRTNVQEAVNGYFFDQEKPSAIRLHLVRDEVLSVG